MAFLGRYAHQDVRTMKSMTVREMMELAQATGELLEEEKKGLPQQD